MEENKNQPEENIPQEKNEAIKKLASNLFKDEKSFDINSIMRMATTLISNDALMSSVKDIANSNSNKSPELKKESQQEAQQESQQESEMALLLQKMDEMVREIVELKQEIKIIKEQNDLIKTTTLKISKESKKKKY